jgi:hypothetical protein
MVTELTAAALLVFVALALYRLLAFVNRARAVHMVIFPGWRVIAARKKYGIDLETHPLPDAHYPGLPAV